MITNKQILQQILELDKYFRHSKKFFRYIEDNDINKFETQPYNIDSQTKFVMKFDRPITKGLQNLHSKVGHYLNQNYLIRLFEVLEAYNISQNINHKVKKKISGAEDIRILKDLRNTFAHNLGKYNSSSENHTNLLNDLMKRYGEKHIVKDEFPISQDKTIKFIIHGIKAYLTEMDSQN